MYARSMRKSLGISIEKGRDNLQMLDIGLVYLGQVLNDPVLKSKLPFAENKSW